MGRRAKEAVTFGCVYPTSSCGKDAASGSWWTDRWLSHREGELLCFGWGLLIPAASLNMSTPQPSPAWLYVCVDKLSPLHLLLLLW